MSLDFVALSRIAGAAVKARRSRRSSESGLRTFAPDRMLKLGFDAHAPGFFWCAGQGGMGIQTAPAASLLCAALIRDEALPEELAGIDPADFTPR